MSPHASFEAKVLAAFTAAVLVVVALSATTWKFSNDAANAAQWVSHTRMVLNNISEVRVGSLQIELSTQNYRMTGDRKNVADMDAAIATRESTLRRLRELTRDNPSQQERWEQLRQVIDQRLRIARHVEYVRQTEGLDAANAYVAKVPLKQTRELVHSLLRDMEAEENRLLESRSAEQLQTQQILTGTSTLVTLSLFALLTGTYVVLRRQWRDAEAARQALAESEEKLSTTLHSIGDAVLATDADGRVTRMNAVAERLTGWRFAEAQGMPVEEVFHIISEHTRAPAVIPVSKVLESGEIQEIANHTALIARDGSECPIADSAAPIRDASGKVGGVVLVFRDVSMERQAKRMLLEQNEVLDQRVREQLQKLDESEDHLRSVIRNVPALIAYVDAQQRYVYVNDQYREAFAPDRADITGCTVREILGEERYAIASPMIAKVLEGAAQHYDWQPFPGTWQVINYAPKRDAQGAVVGYYVLGTDITERKEAEARIQSLNEALGHRVRELKQVTRALRTLSAGNRTMLRSTDEQALLHSMCSAIVDAGGYDVATVWYQADDGLALRLMAESGYPGGLADVSVLEATWAGDEHGIGPVAAAIRTGQTRVVQDMQMAPKLKDGVRGLHGYASMIACPLRVGNAIIGALAIYATDTNAFGSDEVALLDESADDLAYGISTLRVRAEQRKNRAAMHRLAHYDSLTGLPNGTQFTEALTTALDVSLASQPFALLQANIERLSEINDALGFSHGDEMLCEFATRLRGAVPPSAMVARLRGDEFALLLPGSDRAAAIAMARHLREVLTQPFRVADISLDVSAKIGIALFPDHGATPHDLYRNMDIAVHLAKARNVEHVIFDPTQNPDHSRRLTIVSELRRAIEGSDLALYLQPKVELCTGRISGAEGLVRWKHAERGIISPIEFIGLAESTGLIKPLTEWVIEKAMEINQAWSRQGCALPIAVNLSARNLHDEKLLENLRRLQATRGIAAGLFEIELTESSVMEDAQFALRVLYGLREQGIPLYIDDFGTGYSSLSYLQKLPVQYIKIDQSFVRDMSRNKDSESIVRSTIDLIHDLGRMAVAEGIEDQESWNTLVRLGCDLGQGYFVAKPMPAEAFQAWAAAYGASHGAESLQVRRSRS